MLERHVEEVAAAAGRVEHAHGAQAVVEAPHLGTRLGHLPLALAALGQRGGLVRQQQRGGLRVGPVGTQRLHHRGQHESLDVGARRVVRAQGVALAGVERAFEQGAEDRRFDLAPVGARGGEQAVDLGAGERQHVAVGRRALEQLAVEAQQVLGERGAEAAAVHVGPQDAQHLLQRGRVVAVGLQQVHEGAVAAGGLGQQLDVLGKHAEQAAREERGDRLRRVAGGFEAARHRGELHRDLARDLGADARGVE